MTCYNYRCYLPIDSQPPAHAANIVTPSMKTLSLRFAGVILIWLVVCSTAQGASSVWGGLHPIPDAHSLEDVIRQGPSPYIAVGEGGAIVTSSDGVNWTVRASNTVQKLYSVIWDGSQYITVGEGGLVMTSPDGVTWTAQDTNQRKVLFDIAYSPELSRYVAVGQEGTLLTSPDAQTWTQRDPDTGALLQGIVWNANAGLFVAVGSTRTIITSPDGIDWTIRERGSFLNQDNTLLEDIATDGLSQFVVVGRSGKIFSSSDGLTWTEQNSGTTQSLLGVTRAGSVFVAVGVGTAGDPDDPADDLPTVVLISSDGANWVAASDSGTTSFLRAVAGDGSNFVAVGEQTITTSGDSGDNWTELASAVTETFYDIAWDSTNDLYLAVGDTGRIVTSPDGDNWTAQNSTVSNALRGVAWRPGSQEYIAVGDGGTILRSTNDGTTWSAASTNPLTTEALHDVTLAGSRYVAVGEAGTIVTSLDGDTWTSVTPITSSDLNGVAFRNGLYVAVGNDGVILTSTDAAASWTGKFSGVTSALNAVTFVSSAILVVGENGTVLQNTQGDGNQWTSRNPGTNNTLHDVHWNGTQVMAVGAGGSIRRSEDGLRWTSLLSDSDKEFMALAWDGTRFLTAGEGATVRTSGGVDVTVNVSPPDSATVNNAKEGSTGTVFVYTISNIANLDATFVQFQNPLPAAFEYVAAVPPTQLNDPTACGTVSGAIVTCDLGTLVGGSSGLTVIVAVNPLAEGTFSTTATVSAGGDTNPANDQITSSVDVGPEVFNIPDPDPVIDTDAGFGAMGGPTLALLALGLLARRRHHHT